MQIKLPTTNKIKIILSYSMLLFFLTILKNVACLFSLQILSQWFYI